MARPKVTIIGKLRFSQSEGLQWSITVKKGEKQETVWLEGFPQAYDWPGIPKIDGKVDEKALHAGAAYQTAAKELLELQRSEPQPLFGTFWIYKDHALSVETGEPETVQDRARDVLIIKQFVLRRERDYERLKREVAAFENLEKLDRVSRAPIPESVRLFVWQRDGGKCVKCGGHELLEFDHIIPVSKGGSSTERNLQLLCEGCNRSKGSAI